MLDCQTPHTCCMLCLVFSRREDLASWGNPESTQAQLSLCSAVPRVSSGCDLRTPAHSLSANLHCREARRPTAAPLCIVLRRQGMTSPWQPCRRPRWQHQCGGPAGLPHAGRQVRPPAEQLLLHVSSPCWLLQPHPPVLLVQLPSYPALLMAACLARPTCASGSVPQAAATAAVSLTPSLPLDQSAALLTQERVHLHASVPALLNHSSVSCENNCCCCCFV